LISSFIDGLRHKPTENLFNPWFERDKEHDADHRAPEIRRYQLENYLSDRQATAKYLMIAEALGYQGGHFTGIAMTSERILLGHQVEKYGILPQYVFKNAAPVRTSKQEIIKRGMTEPTATIMWGTLIELGIDPYEVVLWNAVPWHPYKKEKGLLSNRTPTVTEMTAGLTHLKTFLSIFVDVELVAVGRKCEQCLSQLGEDFVPVRHPANGGATIFRNQVKELMS
jgi:hypothetical protein